MGTLFGDGILIVMRWQNKGGHGCAHCGNRIEADTEFVIQLSTMGEVRVVVTGHRECFTESWQQGYAGTLEAFPQYRRHHVN